MSFHDYGGHESIRTLHRAADLELSDEGGIAHHSRAFEPDSWIPPSRMEADHGPSLPDMPANLSRAWPWLAWIALLVVVGMWVFA